MGFVAKRSYEINKRLREYIIYNDKKPTAIADKAKIRRDTFSRIINSQRPIYADELLKICKVLNISADYLLWGNCNEN